jgi:hypothetical protein
MGIRRCLGYATARSPRPASSRTTTCWPSSPTSARPTPTRTGLRLPRRCRVRRASPLRGAGFVEAQPVGSIGGLDDREAGKRAEPSRRAIAFRFHPRDVHLAMRQRERGTSVPLRVLVDGEPPGGDHGLNVDEQGHRTLVQPQLCQLLRQPGSITDRTFEITFLAPASRPTWSPSARPPSHFVGRQVRAAGTAAPDDAGWVVLVEDLQ